MLVFTGKVASLRSSAFEGKESTKIQFIDQTDNGIKLIEIKLSENESAENYKIGTTVEIPVQISTVNGNLYYKQDGKIKVA